MCTYMDDTIDFDSRAQERLDAFADNIAPYFTSRPDIGDIAPREHSIEGRLRVAPDSPYRSNVRYSSDSNVVLSVTLRFSEQLMDDYSIKYLRDEFEQILAQSQPPSDNWTSYPMGDVGQAPHIVTLKTRRIPADEVVAFLDRVTSAYRQSFPNTP